MPPVPVNSVYSNEFEFAMPKEKQISLVLDELVPQCPRLCSTDPVTSPVEILSASRMMQEQASCIDGETQTIHETGDASSQTACLIYGKVPGKSVQAVVDTFDRST